MEMRASKVVQKSRTNYDSPLVCITSPKQRKSGRVTYEGRYGPDDGSLVIILHAILTEGAYSRLELPKGVLAVLAQVGMVLDALQQARLDSWQSLHVRPGAHDTFDGVPNETRRLLAHL